MHVFLKHHWFCLFFVAPLHVSGAIFLHASYIRICFLNYLRAFPGHIMNTIAWMLPPYVESTCTQHTNSNINKLYPVFFFFCFLHIIIKNLSVCSFPQVTLTLCCYFVSSPLHPSLLHLRTSGRSPLLGLHGQSAHHCTHVATVETKRGQTNPESHSDCVSWSCQSLAVQPLQLRIFPPLLLPLATLRSVSEGATPSSSR